MMTRRSLLTTAVAVPAVSLLPVAAHAAEPPVFSEDGAAFGGTDPVAYFTDGKPVAGDASFASDWNGARVLFASADNKAAFDADPDAFAPQYGGYCAWALSEGYLAPTVPQAWSIVDGKLYLNASRGIRRRWLRDTDGHIARGDANWPAVLG